MRKNKNDKNENKRKRKRKKKMKLTFQAVSPTESHDQSVSKREDEPKN